jgi:hypothetical protein
MPSFKLNSLEKVKIPTKIKKDKLFKNHSEKIFQDLDSMAMAISFAIMDGDKEAFHDILSGYLSNINKEELARRSKIPIATIRRMAQGANFNVDNMLKVTEAIKKVKAA